MSHKLKRIRSPNKLSASSRHSFRLGPHYPSFEYRVCDGENIIEGKHNGKDGPDFGPAI